jgi:hypothetical protein
MNTEVFELEGSKLNSLGRTSEPMKWVWVRRTDYGAYYGEEAMRVDRRIEFVVNVLESWIGLIKDRSDPLHHRPHFAYLSISLSIPRSRSAGQC